MITPFPIVLELDNNALQVVTAEQLSKLQLPDPETGERFEPHFLLNQNFFTDKIMADHTIIGTSISNGQAIHIPTNYTAQINGKQLNSISQEITVSYSTGSDEDQIITSIYTASESQYIPRTQYLKNVLIWKTIFMNGMTLSLILSFIICKRLMKKRST